MARLIDQRQRGRHVCFVVRKHLRVANGRNEGNGTGGQGCKRVVVARQPHRGPGHDDRSLPIGHGVRHYMNGLVQQRAGAMFRFTATRAQFVFNHTGAVYNQRVRLVHHLFRVEPNAKPRVARPTGGDGHNTLRFHHHVLVDQSGPGRYFSTRRQRTPLTDFRRQFIADFQFVRAIDAARLAGGVGVTGFLTGLLCCLGRLRG